MKTSKEQEPVKPEELRALLIRVGNPLPEGLRRQVLALGEAAVGPLGEVVVDRALDDADEAHGGWAPIHAARLLGDLGLPQAVPALLSAFVPESPANLLNEEAVAALVKLGAHSLEPTLQAYTQATDPDARDLLSEVLAKLGVRDPRILDALLQVLREDPTQGAMRLSQYGDPQALPAVAAAFDAFPDGTDEEAPTLLMGHPLVELRATLQKLGGTLSPAQQERMERLSQANSAWRKKLGAITASMQAKLAAPAAATPRPGRNEPCWCGSGAKYKKCHLSGDKG